MQNLNEALADLIVKTTSAAEKTTDFLLAEVPDVTHQLLLYKMVENSVSLLFIVAFYVAAYKVCKKPVSLFNKEIDKDILDQDASIMFAVPMGLLIVAATSIIFLFVAYNKVAAILKIWLAPKIYLIEYAANLVN